MEVLALRHSSSSSSSNISSAPAAAVGGAAWRIRLQPGGGCGGRKWGRGSSSADIPAFPLAKGGIPYFNRVRVRICTKKSYPD